MMGQTWLRLSNDKFTHKHILTSESLLTHHSSCGHNFSCNLWRIGLKLYTHLDESCIYHVSKYYIDILYHSENIVNLLHHTFFLWDTRYMHSGTLHGKWLWCFLSTFIKQQTGFAAKVLLPVAVGVLVAVIIVCVVKGVRSCSKKNRSRRNRRNQVCILIDICRQEKLAHLDC